MSRKTPQPMDRSSRANFDASALRQEEVVTWLGLGAARPVLAPLALGVLSISLASEILVLTNSVLIESGAT